MKPVFILASEDEEYVYWEFWYAMAQMKVIANLWKVPDWPLFTDW
jgi:hypothetical protein